MGDIPDWTLSIGAEEHPISQGPPATLSPRSW